MSYIPREKREEQEVEGVLTLENNTGSGFDKQITNNDLEKHIVLISNDEQNAIIVCEATFNELKNQEISFEVKENDAGGKILLCGGNSFDGSFPNVIVNFVDAPEEGEFTDVLVFDTAKAVYRILFTENPDQADVLIGKIV